MRNYIEDATGIIPFDKIVELAPYSGEGRTGVQVFCMDGKLTTYYDKNYQEELTAFKAWLKAQEPVFSVELSTLEATDLFERVLAEQERLAAKEPMYEGRAMECANHGRTPDGATNMLSVCTGCGNCMGCGCICYE